MKCSLPLLFALHNWDIKNIHSILIRERNMQFYPAPNCLNIIKITQSKYKNSAEKMIK